MTSYDTNEPRNVNLEIYALLMQIQEHIPRGPSQVLSESIRFEDVLGRVRSLPYEYFRHWQVSTCCLTPGTHSIKYVAPTMLTCDLGIRVPTASRVSGLSWAIPRGGREV